jgi:predicted RNA-binding protein YlqC (UPF0109 family)
MDNNLSNDIISKAQECAEYILSIYRPLTFNPHNLSIHTSLKDSYIHFQISSSERDDGILIGRSGATIQSIRLLIHAYSKANLQGTPCVLEVKDHRNSKYNPLSGSLYRKNR